MHLYLESLHSGFIMQTADSRLFYSTLFTTVSGVQHLYFPVDLKTDLSINVSPVCIK